MKRTQDDMETKKSRIYTRGGDAGTTSLIGGSRVKKCSKRLEAYGTVDELSAHLGLLASMVAAIGERHVSLEGYGKDTATLFAWLQSRMFDVGTHLAMPAPDGEEAACGISEEHVSRLERLIDECDAQVTPLRSFILPGGCMAASQCHVCRTVCRRAERLIIALSEEVPVCPSLLAFMNRLSDFLFVYARLINKMEGIGDFFWSKDGI